MSTPHPPGYTLGQPFDLMAASADLIAVSTVLQTLTHQDDGSPASTQAIRDARRLADRLSARIRKHQAD
ncbi:hypothetical protein [Kitasatospora sp. P5_F3]